MRKRIKKVLSTLLAATLVFGLFAAMQLTASAEADAFTVSEHPEGNKVYTKGAAATPLSATFLFEPGELVGSVAPDTPVTVQWFWSETDSITPPRQNGSTEFPFEYSDSGMECNTTLTPATDTVGVRYYYAVITYAQMIWQSTGEYGGVVEKEAVTETARIEVVESGEPEGKELPVMKTDADGNLLSGAVMTLVPDDDYEQDPLESYEETTVDGLATFTAAYGYYVLSEKQPPPGYNGTDVKYYIYITANGVYEYDPETDEYLLYEVVTFINKEIPKIDKDDHRAFLQGYPGGTFGPNDNMSRAEAVVMFSRLLLKKMEADDTCKNNYYPDVKPTNWFAAHVGYMQDLGVLEFYSRDEKFRPNDPVTRAEFATLATAFEDLVLISTNKFPDVPNDHWAVKFINSAAEKGWILGYDDGTFRPEEFITRAEVATLAGRVLDRYADSEYLITNAESLPRTYSDVSPCWYYLAVMEASIGHEFTRGADGETEHWTSVRP